MNSGGDGSRVSRPKKWQIVLCIVAGLALAFWVGRAALGDLAAVEKVRGESPASLTTGD
jgi:hypothetical protein